MNKVSWVLLGEHIIFTLFRTIKYTDKIHSCYYSQRGDNMKSSVVPFAAGAMTVLGVWMVASNKKKIDKIVKNVSDTMNQMLQTCKKTLQEDSCTCNSQN